MSITNILSEELYKEVLKLAAIAANMSKGLSRDLDKMVLSERVAALIAFLFKHQ